MSKKSIGELSVAPDPVELDRRLPPPADLTAVEAQIWNSVVATKPADWFQADCAPILVAYCKHISTAMVLDEMIVGCEPENLESVFFKLIDERRKETSKIESCATKLRLTPQARYNAKNSHTAHQAGGLTVKKPWDQKVS